MGGGSPEVERRLLGSLSELERATITERMAMGRNRVARAGRWTNGPVPYGFDLDDAGCLIPSNRLVPELGITEANLAREIFHKVADGGSAMGVVNWLNSLGVRPTHRYGGGVERKIMATRWIFGRIIRMLHSEVYKGMHTLHTKGELVVRTDGTCFGG